MDTGAGGGGVSLTKFYLLKLGNVLGWFTVWHFS